MTPDPPRAPAAGPAPAPRVALRLVVVPTEHGSWSFLFEPIALGLLVSPSWSGALVALAALAAFLARQPLKLFVVDRRRGKVYPRTHVAERAFATLALLAAAALAGAVVTARGPLLVAVGLAAPLAAATLAFDLDRRSREAAGELAGALAVGAVASAVALAGGWPAARSFALWGVLAGRTVPTILFVRARLRLEKGQPPRMGWALASQALAIGGVALLALRRVAPWAAAAAMAVLAARAAWGLSPARPRLKTWQLGLTEIGYGLLVVLATALGR